MIVAEAIFVADIKAITTTRINLLLISLPPQKSLSFFSSQQKTTEAEQ